MGDIIMIKKYIRGNEERGAEVIKALEDLGGVNCNNITGIRTDCFYYIKEDSIIDVVQDFTALGEIIQECFEEIKLPEQFSVAIKEPKQIYWFRATEDTAKNQVLLDKLSELSGHSDISLMTSRKSCIYFNEFDKIVCYDIENKLSRMAMMVGKELVIEQ